MDLMTLSAQQTLKRHDEITVVIESSSAEPCSAIGFLMIHRSVDLENFAGRSLFYLSVERPDGITVTVMPSQSSTSELRLYGLLLVYLTLMNQIPSASNHRIPGCNKQDLSHRSK